MRRILILVLGALVLSLLPAAPAQAVTVREGANFNTPTPWGSLAARYAIIDKVVTATHNTPGPSAEHPNPRILVTSFLFDYGPAASALIAACKRGVSVRVILDGDIDTGRARNLIAALSGDDMVDTSGDGVPDPETGPCGEGEPEPVAPPPAGGTPDQVQSPDMELGDGSLPSTKEATTMALATGDSPAEWGGDKSYVKRCKGSCRGGGGNMHTKFYAFSRTGAAEDVVMVSSSNLNKGGGNNGWNDMYTMVGRPASFTLYNQIHREMTNDRNVATPQRVEIADGPFTSRFFPIKDADKADDPVMQDLNQIRCSSDFGRTKLFISMFYWKGTRGDYIADKLLGLAKSGCRVNIVYGAPSVAIATRLRQAARKGLIRVYDSRWDFNKDGWNEVRVHAKYIALKGSYRGDRSAHVVMTGSQNWVRGSLVRGDESSLNIHLASAYQQYVANWERVRNHSRRVPYNR